MIEEQKCYKCAKLLFVKNDIGKTINPIDVEVICPGCRYINYTGTPDGIGLRGKDFQARSIDLRCEKCGRLQARATGDGEVVFKCRCGKITEYNTLNIRSGKQVIKIKKESGLAI